MDLQKILFLSNHFYRLAAVQSVMKLKDPMGKKFLGSDLWFTKKPSTGAFDPINFAVFDEQNKKKIEEMGLYNDYEIGEIYFENYQIQQLLKFIVNSFDKHFPGLDGWKQYDYLNKREDFITQNPTFILMHDLIHKVLDANFEKNLEQQQMENGNEVVVLIDEIKEDIASMLSNIETDTFKTGAGIDRYVQYLFRKYFKDGPITEKHLKNAIDKTFHQAKAELRGKIDSHTMRRRMGKKELAKYRSTEQASNKVKQLIDGVLSKYKKQMLELVPSILDKITSNTHPSWVWKYFENGMKDVHLEYQQKMREADILDPIESSNLRAWMIECLGKMRQVANYFQTQYKKETLGYDEDYPDLDEDDEL